MGGRRGCWPFEKELRLIPESGVRVGLVSREFARDLGIPEVFFGIVPVPLNPYEL